MLMYETIKAYDGAVLRAARFDADVPATGVIQLIHGFGEGIGHYKDVANFFASFGYACIIHEQRGYGYDCLLDDIKAVRTMVEKWYPQLPVFLYGHSMGGNIAINYLLKNPQKEYEKVIIGAPWLRLYKPKLITTIAGLIGKILPGLVIPKWISFSLFKEIVDAGEYAINNAAKITLPTLLLCPGMDKIVCTVAIREFGKCAKDNVIMIEYPEGRHSLHLDTIRDRVLGDIIGFLW